MGPEFGLFDYALGLTRVRLRDFVLGSFVGMLPDGMTYRSQTPAPAVSFALPDSRGQTHTLSDYHGHWLLLVFHRHLG